uniref:Uncharacterized protein n=1 Tax=Rhizophora mucronata TaxID=61149 RepID=A0A2P2QFQ0_RHIMU
MNHRLTFSFLPPYFKCCWPKLRFLSRTKEESN